ncbi:uncharacterized protein LOC110892900 [Helianthus annuus]|uniref:uncharacterized protein LOC110892900 n=1 Tax=Helianthus annuus TaxID=4232 RepID=UPI0016530539|nr:uncharacterized protein LOC110892900 [Helianthus annuus]
MSSKREMLEQKFEGFSYSYGESIDAVIGRFVELLSEMEKAEMVVSPRIINRKLLEAIKGIPNQANCSWFMNVNQIIVTTDGNCYKMKSDELISLIKSYGNADSPQSSTSMFNKPMAQEVTRDREEILSVFCTPECRKRNEAYRLHNAEPDDLGENGDACVTENESANRANWPAETSDSKCESPEAAVSEKSESFDYSEFSSRVSCGEPTCAENSSKVSAEVSATVSGISSNKPELSDSVKADTMKDEEKTDVKRAPNAQAEQSEPSVSGEKVQIKQQEPKQAGKGRGNKKPKHQRQEGSPQSSTGSNSHQKARDVKNTFVKPVSNGKCEKYAFDCANKAFGKTGEISEHDVQSTQNKKTQKKSPPQKAHANDKYRHPNSSSSARNVQQNQAQKGPVRPSGSSRANPVDQNAFYSPWLENRELRSELHDPGKRRMIKMNNRQGNGREINNDPDYISPRLRAIAILKQQIAIMELQYEIALLGYESGRHEDNGDAGEVITRKEDNSMLQEIEFEKQDKEEDDLERDEMACEDVLNKKDKIQQDEDCCYNRKDDKDKKYDKEMKVGFILNNKIKSRIREQETEENIHELQVPVLENVFVHGQRRNRDSVIHFSDKERKALVTEEGFYTTEGLLA